MALTISIVDGNQNSQGQAVISDGLENSMSQFVLANTSDSGAVYASVSDLIFTKMDEFFREMTRLYPPPAVQAKIDDVAAAEAALAAETEDVFVKPEPIAPDPNNIIPVT